MTNQKQTAIDKDCIKKAVNIVMKETNNWVINTNKKYHTAYETVNPQKVINIINEFKDPNKITESLIITAQLINKIYEQQRKEYYLNKAYGKEYIHPSELPKEDNKEDASKKATRKANKAKVKKGSDK